MHETIQKIRKWWPFAVVIATGFLFFRLAPSTPSSQPVLTDHNIVRKQVFPALPQPVPVIENKMAAMKPLNFKRRVASAQTPPTAEQLLPHALLNPTPWKIWLNTQAIRSEDRQTADVVLAQVSRMLIIESSAENANLTEFNSSLPIVVYDARLKKAGLINGMIRIQTLSKAQLEADLAELNARITDSFDAINTYFVTGSDPVFNLESLFLLLKAKPYVKAADLDITSRTYEKY